MLKKIFFSVIIIGLCSNLDLKSQDKPLQIINVEALETLMEDNDQLTIINFWATWCKPCIKELPYFVAAQGKFPNVNFVYISLDYAEKAERAEKFALKKGLNEKALYLIDNVDYNSWIDKVSPDWSGAIPATLVIQDGKKYLYEQEFKEGELTALIKEKLK